MTKTQIRKLETIIGKLEALQNELKGKSYDSLLSEAKSRLIETLRQVEDQQS